MCFSGLSRADQLLDLKISLNEVNSRRRNLILDIDEIEDAENYNSAWPDGNTPHLPSEFVPSVPLYNSTMNIDDSLSNNLEPKTSASPPLDAYEEEEEDNPDRFESISPEETERIEKLRKLATRFLNKEGDSNSSKPGVHKAPSDDEASSNSRRRVTTVRDVGEFEMK